jgi:hypothetical protein
MKFPDGALGSQQGTEGKKSRFWRNQSGLKVALETAEI